MRLSSIVDLITVFDTEDKCRAHFESIRWPDGVTCPHCGHDHIYRYKDYRYRCAGCGKDFRIKTGTIFGDSKISLRKWFLAIYLLITNKKGISSTVLAAQLGVTQKTAWFMNHRIRTTLKREYEQLRNEVEIDETYIGGKNHNRHKSKKIKNSAGRSLSNKSVIMGMLERGGDMQAHVIPDTKTETLRENISQHVDKNARVFTDDYRGYRKINDRFRRHVRIDHSWGAYTDGDDGHTNAVEGFWAIFKRSYYGIYHQMSKKHLQRYVDEISFRYNQRQASTTKTFNTVMMQAAEMNKVGWKELTYSK